MGGYRYTFAKFLKDWALIIGMIVGASLYLIYHAIPVLHPAGPVLERIVKEVQPMLLFAMLFLSFIKIEPHQMRPHKWMVWLLLFQCVLFVGLALLLRFFPSLPLRYGIESAMLCLICPTATACAVVTGDMVKPGAVVIDVGMNRDAEGKLCGDVDFVGARQQAAWITPVPGGVGPMTIAMLMENTVECFLARQEG